MLNSIEGIYRKGKVELAEVPSNKVGALFVNQTV